MNTIDMKVKISTLWIVVMFNMVSADIIGFMNPGDLQKILTGNVGINITQELLLIFSVMMEIPIAMIFLSRVLKSRPNRWANIIAGAITVVFVIGGGDTYPSYIFFASVEVICVLLIVWYAWKLSEPGPGPG
jgi:Sec-independent protein secretion pathway component TatC